jgi:nickel-dependent lactate racemase
MSIIKLPEFNWYGSKIQDFFLPDRWQVDIYNMAGYDKPAMKASDIRAVLNNPIGTLPLKELATGKKEVVIIFDDMSRVTRTAEIAHEILKELAEAGIGDKHIRFVCALGCHGSLTRLDFVKKLGEDVLARFPIYNHNPFGNCVRVGKTKTYGTEVEVNEEVMSCDFKIAVGMVVPHPMSGFGGGGKIILPGVCSLKTIQYNHELSYRDIATLRGKMGSGRFDENPMHFDIEEAAEIAGLDFIVNAIVNSCGETVGLYAGVLKPAYAAAIKTAKAHYLTPKTQDNDIVISNAFIKANEAFIGLNIANAATSRQGGSQVLIANAPEGMVIHYLLGPFGAKSYGPLYYPSRVPNFVKQLIIYTEYPDLASIGWYTNQDKITFAYKWGDVLKMLEKDYPGSAKVAVFPNSEIQYF